MRTAATINTPAIRAATADDVAAMADIHAAAFDAGAAWNAVSIRKLLETPATFALVSDTENPAGFIMMRAVAGEAEILTLAVDPGNRRRGIARALVLGGLATALAAGCETVFLEVAADNDAAAALYRSLDFEPAGERKAYYARPGGSPVDARILRWAPQSPDKS